MQCSSLLNKGTKVNYTTKVKHGIKFTFESNIREALEQIKIRLDLKMLLQNKNHVLQCRYYTRLHSRVGMSNIVLIIACKLMILTCV